MRKVPQKQSLLYRFPAVADEWNSDRNDNLTPRQISAFSDRKVWWRCVKGHEWKARVAHRSNGSGCPYCAGKRASAERNLATEFPDVAAEWHPTKNGLETPEHVTPFSGKKRWWQCSHGHEWQATVASRSSGRACPLCWKHSSRPELRLLAELQTLFDPVLRRRKFDGVEVDLFIEKYKIGIEYDGSYWHRNLGERDRQKNRQLADMRITLIRVREEPLPMISDFDISCSKRRLTKKAIDTLLNRIKSFCDADDREKIDAYRASRKFQNPEAYAKYVSEIRNPIPEDSLEIRHPDLAEQWDFRKNGSLLPKDFSRGSQEKVWWRCGKGHSWKTAILTRTVNGSGCPYCAGNLATESDNLAVRFPKIAEEWHPNKNGSQVPSRVRPLSNQKVWWKCPKGHSWTSTVASRVRFGAQCPYCSGRTASKERNFATVHPDLVAEWHSAKNIDLRPTDVTPASGKKVWWQCQKGHEWEATVHSRHKGSACPFCLGRRVSDDNNLAAKFPRIAAEWDEERNAPLTPNRVTYGSKKKVWWRCDKGHSWQATINSRTNRSHKRGCPTCASN